MDCKCSAGAEPGAVEVISSPVIESRRQTSAGDAEGDWLCAACLKAVANEKDRFAWNGATEFVFTNPDGFRFEIITFSRAPGCRDAGAPILDHTWFEGHAWSYCLCGGCGRHLGWYYTGKHTFAGLIAARLVRALYLRN